MTEIDEVLHRLGKAFVAGLREPAQQLRIPLDSFAGAFTSIHPCL
ncbi:hypothetical protein [Actinoplanes aureus]|nr:hypothetical protein [Actinoplanes aureus]